MEDDTTIEESVIPRSLIRSDQLWLLVVSGPDAGRWLRVPVGGGVVGRQGDSEIRLEDPGISRRHAVLIPTEAPEYVLRDLASRNGLFVQGRRVREHRLLDGDQVQLTSTTVLRARYSAPTEGELIDELQQAASTDPLTGVPNRRYLLARLEQEIAFAFRHRAALSVLLIDVDGFKQVNDRHGHGAGDLTLRTIARTLAATVRTEDVLGRYGGDEFAVIARGQGPQEASLLADRLCRSVGGQRLVVGAHTLDLTLSIGVAGIDENEGGASPVPALELLARADFAMYRAKQGGKNGVAQWRAPNVPEPDPKSWMRRTGAGARPNTDPRED